MKFTIPRNDLADMLAKGGTSNEKVTTVPILKHARLIAKDNQLRVSTTNLDLQAETIGAVSIDIEGETTVDAEKLKSTVDRLPRGADISIWLDGGDLFVKSGRSRVRLPTLPVSNWPSLDSRFGSDAARFTLSGAELDRLLGRTTPVGALETVRAALQGVFVHVREWEGVRALAGAASNGHTFLITTIEAEVEGAEYLPANGGGDHGILLPIKTAEKALALFRGESSVRVSATANRIIFEGGTTVLASKLAEASFPDYRRFVPEKSGNVIRIDRADCSTRVALLETFATKEHGHKIEASPSDSGLVMAASGGDEGEGFAVAEAEYEGESLAFGLSSQYLKTMLSAFRAEVITMSVESPASPILFTADTEIDTLGIVMPMRVSGDLARRGFDEPARS